MVFYDEAEARKLYERYKLQWMVYHGLGLVDLMDWYGSHDPRGSDFQRNP